MPADDALGVAAKVRAGASALDLIEERLEEIERRSDLGAFWVVDAEGACAEAVAVDDAIKAGRDPGPFAGVPVGWKDCFDVAGLPTTAGLVAVRRPARGARRRGRCADARGRRRLGRQGRDARARLGDDGWAHRRPSCPNPYAPGRTAGGSSTGSAVAVATGLVDLAPGTDTGGSVRVPASLCGVVGMKPTLGSVPLDGCIPYAKSLDTAGPIARSVRDCAVAVAVLAAHGTSQPPVEALDGVHIGVLERHFCEDLDPGVEAAFRAALEALARAGAVLDTVALGWQDDADVLLPIYLCEPLTLVGEAVQADPSAFGSDVVQDVTRGLGLHALDYLRALERLEARRRRALPALAEVDLVACPTRRRAAAAPAGERRDPPPQPQHQAVQRARLAGHQPAVRAGRRGAAGRSPARGGARRGLAPPGAGDLRRGGARLAPRRARRRELTPLRRASAAARGRRRRGG